MEVKCDLEKRAPKSRCPNINHKSIQRMNQVSQI